MQYGNHSSGQVIIAMVNKEGTRLHLFILNCLIQVPLAIFCSDHRDPTEIVQRRAYKTGLWMAFRMAQIGIFLSFLFKRNKHTLFFVRVTKEIGFVLACPKMIQMKFRPSCLKAGWRYPLDKLLSKVSREQSTLSTG